MLPLDLTEILFPELERCWDAIAILYLAELAC